MPKFRYVTSDDIGGDPPELMSLPTIEAARSEMVSMAGQMLKDIKGAFWQDSDWRLDLHDEAGLILCSIMIHGFEAPALSRG